MKSLRGLLISNCQAQPLAHALNLLCSDISFEYLGVHTIPPANRVTAFADAATRYKDCDVVVSVPLSADFGLFTMSNIRKTFPGRPIALIHNLYFSGLHPDLTYVGGLGGRIKGPMSDYHSKLGILAFISGRTVKEALQLFTSNVYKAVGFYDECDKSIAEIQAREIDLDIAISAKLMELVRIEPRFLTVNHPTPSMFAVYAGQIGNWLSAHGLGPLNLPLLQPAYLANYLARDAYFPVYPEVAQHHGLRWEGSYLFKLPQKGDDAPRILGLEEFLHDEFVALSSVGAEGLKRSPQVASFLKVAASSIFDRHG